MGILQSTIDEGTAFCKSKLIGNLLGCLQPQAVWFDESGMLATGTQIGECEPAETSGTVCQSHVFNAQVILQGAYVTPQHIV